jgi:hypothetical protein
MTAHTTNQSSRHPEAHPEAHTGAQAPRPLRRMLKGLRRAHDDARYLNHRMLDRPW